MLVDAAAEGVAAVAEGADVEDAAGVNTALCVVCAVTAATFFDRIRVSWNFARVPPSPSFCRYQGYL